MKQSKVTCFQCKWYMGDREVGPCHRYPPTIRSVYFEGKHGVIESVALGEGPFHPRVKAYDFCGEHVARET